MFLINWLGLLGRFWYVIPLVALSLSTMLYKHQATSERNQRLNIQAEFDQFKVGVRLAGESQIKRNHDHEAQDKLNKENSDKSNAKVKSDLNTAYADLKRLRNSSTANSGGGLLPPTGPGSPSPDKLCFDKPFLGRALQEYEDSVTGLLEEGDQGIADLNTSKEWIKNR